MRVLIADDDPVSQRLLERLLIGWGHEVATADDGTAALAALQASDAPRLAILDWSMPGLEGPEICRRLRAATGDRAPYLILLTARDGHTSVVAGLRCGANDYVTKPFEPDELQARVGIAVRTVDLQDKLAQRVRELEHALAHVRRLQGILPICSYCKKVRTDQNYWQQVETYLADHADLLVSHGICPDCLVRVMAEARAQLGLPPTEA
jgi:sigma-B regulation protein RsbU (phosphoserine phosphatase)